MYNPRQARLQSGVNGGRFASYGAPHTSKASTRHGKGTKRAKAAKSGKQTARRQRASKQLTVSGRSRIRARTAAKAAGRGRGRLRGRHR